MSLGPRRAATIWLIAGLLFAFLAACSQAEGPEEGKWGRGVYVQEAWRVARAVTGHRMHVVKHKTPCTKCHEMTNDEVGKVDTARCASCHEKQAHIEHASKQAAEKLGPGAKADCTSCHVFTLDGSGHENQIRMVDPAHAFGSGSGGGGTSGTGGSDGGGSGGVGGSRPWSLIPVLDAFAPGDCKRCHAKQQGDIPPVEVHGTQECLTCHRPHDDAKPQSAPCADCHDDVHTTHATAGKTPTQVCQTCHADQHAKGVAAGLRCAGCHATEKPIIPATALFAGGHTECTGCHRPHDFDRKVANDCRSCHGEQHVIGGGRIVAHNTCTSCHSPHDVKGSPDAACANCHRSVHPDHPKRGEAGTCVGCHDPHPQTVQAGSSAKNCSSCHQFAASDHAAHAGVDCVKCHQPHAFKLKERGTAVCSSCHAQRVQQVSVNAGHQACQGCHSGLPHKPKGLMKGCATCHQSEQSQVRSGHQQCLTCHEPHSGSRQKECGSCHKQEAASAPKGHQACTSCHQPHSGSLGGKVCSTCHKNEAASAHGKLKQGCTSCHRPHGPGGVASPPTCTTCHERTRLPGLHSQPQHQPCTKCHSGHGDQPSMPRNACLSCHQDRKNHFPDAPRCANCHLFTPSR